MHDPTDGEVRTDVRAAPRTSEAESPPAAPISLTILLVIVAVISLLLLGLPLVRDAIIARLPLKTSHWLSLHKVAITSWLEWLKVLFESLLAILISNQIFNEPIRNWFKDHLEILRLGTETAVTKSLRRDDIRKEVRQLILEVASLTSPIVSLRDAIRDFRYLLGRSLQLARGLEFRLLYLGLRLVTVKFLAAFTQQLHALAACVMFLFVLIAKIGKLYMEGIRLP